jgi:transketolase
MNTPRYESVLRGLAEADDRVMVLTAENRAAIRNLPGLLGPRFVDVGICEQTMIGMCAGLALRGRRPVAHALATFLTLRAFEFIRDDLGIPSLGAVLVGGVPGFLSEANGPTHQAVDDVALMRTIPNVHVVCPADEHELAEALPALVAEGSPVYVRHIGLMPSFTRKKAFAVGEGEVLCDGEDVGVLCYGLMTREAMTAAATLSGAGLSVRVVHLPSVKPIDEALVIRTLTRCRLTFTVEDHLLAGGLFSIVAELMARRGVSARVVPFALEERWFVPTLLPKVLEHEGFSGERLASRMLRVAEVAS